MTMFNNCYTFNPPEYGVYSMARSLEHYILAKMETLPPEDDVSLMCKNVENLYREKMKLMPPQVFFIEMIVVNCDALERRKWKFRARRTNVLGNPKNQQHVLQLPGRPKEVSSAFGLRRFSV
ncbi:unnamed protein product [Gongylonema pulchrum]|uniref:Bromo domain-containing protein n=1 Tax=Gongylonema pulchrum TaxID=637853 RepID=A0A183F1D6_9BILA|nr:unnamed protein product [Gongylonema pulchrum]